MKAYTVAAAAVLLLAGPLTTALPVPDPAAFEISDLVSTPSSNSSKLSLQSRARPISLPSTPGFSGTSSTLQFDAPVRRDVGNEYPAIDGGSLPPNLNQTLLLTKCERLRAEQRLRKHLVLEPWGSEKCRPMDCRKVDPVECRFCWHVETPREAWEREYKHGDKSVGWWESFRGEYKWGNEGFEGIRKGWVKDFGGGSNNGGRENWGGGPLCVHKPPREMGRRR
ncbi:uncharacterized protein BDZ99DRAFT_569046 [Mytilinidion resinicola]|uniref:Uncharacterized protein n=1 Tax=Mytilinidion resinicola TaxID=574789 RepID=A0A6A6YWS4_9PEZI|nr:uncharacterized protein BDZ99DRAFT_569046 [Mytilinidion resinicola]KAF2812357.1 hypothetical protein BDZ99DRAFT_569046 [Mytilinidion resinicola]